MEKFKDIFAFAPKSKIKAGEGLEKGRFPFYTSSAIQNKWIDTEQHFDEALIFGTGGSANIHYESQPFSTSTDCFVTITTRKDVNTKYVYYFILVTHILLSIVIIPFVLITYVRALSQSFERHKKLARITYPLWLYVAVTGVVVYIMISPYYAH